MDSYSKLSNNRKVLEKMPTKAHLKREGKQR